MSLNHHIGSSLIEFEQLDSTNDYAMHLANEGNVDHGTTILAKYQTKGKGQQGKHWHAAKEKNLLMSVILNATQKNIQTQFELNAAFCSAIAHMLMEDYEIGEACIKWPNDLYIGRKKIAGILIENIIQGQQWKYAIVGIGLNVNQVQFPQVIQATSMIHELGKKVDLVLLRKRLFVQLNKAYKNYLNKDQDLLFEYNSLLHGFDHAIEYEKDGKKQVGHLFGADVNGFLKIDNNQYRHGEIKLLL